MRDRMPPEMLARARGQAENTNRLNQLAHLAAGHGGSRQGQRTAEATLFQQLGSRKAKKLIKQASKSARGSF